MLIAWFVLISFNSINSYSNSEKTYFKTHQWDFMEKISIEYPNDQSSIYNCIPKITAFSLFFSLLFTDLNDETFSGFLFISLLTFAIYKLSDKFINKYFKNLIEKDKIFKVLKWFFKNYNPDINLNPNNNLKQFVPKELFDTFDNIFFEYKKLGNKFLRKNAINIIYEIQNRIKYDIKKEKYKNPNIINIYETNNYNNPYGNYHYTYPNYNYRKDTYDYKNKIFISSNKYTYN